MKYLVSFWDWVGAKVGEAVLCAESETKLLEECDVYAEENFQGFGITTYKFKSLEAQEDKSYGA